MEEPLVGSIDGLQFQRWDEDKVVQQGTKFLKFLMVDGQGHRHLAAVAEDAGDAHYTYYSTEAFNQRFGKFTGHNRRDLTQWLEMVLRESLVGTVQGPMDPESVVHIGEPTKEDPYGTFFVRYRQDKSMTPDGRRCNRWFLIDQHGGEHLAVVGHERDTRDGHYQYTAEEPFTSKFAFNAHNIAGVQHWMESFLTHHCPPGTTIDYTDMRRTSGELHPESFPSCAAGDSVQGSEQAVGPLVIDHSHHHHHHHSHGHGHQSNPGAEQSQAGSMMGTVGASGILTGLPGRPSSTSLPGSLLGSISLPLGMENDDALLDLNRQPSFLLGLAQDGGFGEVAGTPGLIGMELDVGMQGGLGDDFRLSEPPLSERPSTQQGPGTEAPQGPADTGVAGDRGQGAGAGLPPVPKPPKSGGKAGQAKGGSHAKGAGQGKGGGQKQRLVGVAHDAHLKRLRRIAAESQEALRAAQLAHLLKLRRGAAAESAARDVTRRAAAAWVRGDPGPDEAGVLSQWGETLQELLRDANKSSLQTVECVEIELDPDLNTLITRVPPVSLRQPGAAAPASNGPSHTLGAGPKAGQPSASGAPPVSGPASLPGHMRTVQTWTYADPFINKHAVRLILECMREMAALALPLQALVGSPLIDTLRAYGDTHPHPTISRFARQILGRWQRAALVRVAALTSRSLLEDPVAQLDARIAEGAIQWPAEVQAKAAALQAAAAGELGGLQQEVGTPGSAAGPYGQRAEGYGDDTGMTMTRGQEGNGAGGQGGLHVAGDTSGLGGPGQEGGSGALGGQGEMSALRLGGQEGDDVAMGDGQGERGGEAGDVQMETLLA